MAYAPWNWTAFPEANFTYIGNYTGIFEYMNIVTYDLFGIVLLIALFSVFFLGMGLTNIKKSFLVSGHLTFVIALGFWLMGLVSETVMVLMAIITIGMTLYFAFGRK